MHNEILVDELSQLFWRENVQCKDKLLETGEEKGKK